METADARVRSTFPLLQIFRALDDAMPSLLLSEYALLDRVMGFLASPRPWFRATGAWSAEAGSLGGALGVVAVCGN
eukprot:5312330-Prymnesium_polylepis.1